ncbi:PilZ domain-containing protein [Pseudodesulfovibrio sediminis]|uniref:PilZ domain-containing protein n=1 Tax=Pseudodesulfovibrio sediminis TaxID=2810563 RepID=A0ABN6EPV9_9BACT|nr:PilZ domain-containing protein [Pseudodesulfovibrio sediminis]BCS87482.1 hypothetical protein PSDVSF_07240 [Pseudodesulfovibrio sediminis]
MGLLDSIIQLFAKSKPAANTKAGKKGTAKKARQKDLYIDKEVCLEDKATCRKNAKKVKADPIDEAALGFSISLKGDDAQTKKRSSIRISVKGLEVFVHRLKKSYPVTNISASGLGFKFEKPRIKSGVKIKLDIVLDGKKEAVDVPCKVHRHEKGNVGCRFLELQRAQEDAVCKLVLLGQKQQAARRAAQKDKDLKPQS